MPGVAGVASADDPSSRGKALFNGAAACAGCHSVEPGVVLVGPSLSTLAKAAGERIRDPHYQGTARTPAAYLEESLLKPSAYIVPDGVYASPQGVSFMPDTYERTLKPEDVKDLIAYLMTLQ